MRKIDSFKKPSKINGLQRYLGDGRMGFWIFEKRGLPNVLPNGNRVIWGVLDGE